MDKKQKEQIIKDVFEILGKTFKALDEAYGDEKSGNKEGVNNPFMSTGSYIVFPEKGGNVTRVSEQELRFEFIHQLLESGKEYFYSIETPSKSKYIFSEGSAAKKNAGDCYVPCENDTFGQSAMFDLVLFDTDGKRVCLLEFKSGNADQKEYEKDILKLNKEKDDMPCFFINLLENFENGTLINIGYKIQGKDRDGKDVIEIPQQKDNTIRDSNIFFITHNVGHYALNRKNKEKKEYSLLFAQNGERKKLWNLFKQEKEEWRIIPYEDGKLELNDDEIKKLVNK